MMSRRVLDADGEAHRDPADAGCNELFVCELAASGAGGAYHAGAGVSNMHDDGRELEAVHEAYWCASRPPLTPKEITPQALCGRYFLTSAASFEEGRPG